MFKSIDSYNADSNYHGTVSLEKDELVVLLEKSTEYWWLISNQNSKNGFVPASKLTPISVDVKSDQVLSSINKAIENLSKNLTDQNKKSIVQLQSQRSQLLRTHSKSLSIKRRAPPPPPSRKAPVEQEIKINCETSAETSTVNVAEQTSSKETKETIQLNKSKTNDVASIIHVAPENLAEDLINVLQSSCKITKSSSVVGITSVLKMLSDKIPTTSSLFEPILKSLEIENDSSDENICQLELDFANLCEIKDDKQQRNWKVHDDHDIIVGVVKSIQNLLTMCEHEKCLKVLKKDDFKALRTIVTYHQMETDLSLKLNLLQIFGVITTLFPCLNSFLLTSVLPLELISEIRNHTDEIERTCFSGILLSALLSQFQEDFTVQLENVLNEDFCRHITNTIENQDTDDNVVTVLIKVLLAINLHYADPCTNIVMKSIDAARSRLCEEILLLFNRGEDPCKVESQTNKADSIVKFFTDVFASGVSESLIYTNDLMVLVDIVIRNLSDLPPCNKRTEILDLLLNMVSNENEAVTSRFSQIKPVLDLINKNDVESETYRVDTEIIKAILQNKI